MKNETVIKTQVSFLLVNKCRKPETISSTTARNDPQSSPGYFQAQWFRLHLFLWYRKNGR